MSKLTVQSGQEIIKYNIDQIYHLPNRYNAIHHYLDGKPLRQTLLSILKYAKNKELIIDQHRYEFVLDTGRLTQKVRRRQTGRTVSNHHLNMLCAMGLLRKIPQTQESMLRINQDWLDKQPEGRRAMNVIAFQKYTVGRLDEIENKCIELRKAGVTAGNISFNLLALRGLADIAEEVYPNNNRKAPMKKITEAALLFSLMDMLTSRDGYTTREEVRDNLTLDDSEIDKLFRIFKKDIEEIYRYSSPTKEQIKKWGLKNRKYIYTKRQQE